MTHTILKCISEKNFHAHIKKEAVKTTPFRIDPKELSLSQEYGLHYKFSSE